MEKAAAKRKRKAERQSPPPSKYAKWNATPEADEDRERWLASKTITQDLDLDEELEEWERASDEDSENFIDELDEDESEDE